MKQCPSCQRTYADNAQKFCLQDGTPLVDVASPGAGATPFNNPSQAGAPQPTPSYGAGPTPPYGASPFPPPPPPPGAPPAPPRKRRIWPWVLGIVALLGFGTLALIGGGIYYAYKHGKVTVNGKVVNNVETKSYVNSREGLGGKLSEHYADFSFNYPADWELVPEDRAEGSNFVKVERKSGDSTLENFAVGWYTSTGTVAGDRAIFPQLAQQLSSQFSQGFPEYEKVFEGQTKIGAYDAYEFRFKSTARKTPKGDINLWGRVAMIPSGSAAQKNGVALIMLASSLAPEIKRLEDVGVKGELPVIINSFRLGSTSSASADTGAGESDEMKPVGDDADAPTDREEVMEQLRELEDEWSRANIEGDREAIESILAEEYVGVAGDGSRQTKAQYVSTLKPDPSIKSQTFKKLDLMLGGDRATLSGLTDVKFADGRTATYRFVDVFTWREGRWQAVSSQTSPVE